MSQKIAVLRFSALGDVAMLIPVLRIAKQQYPDIDFHIYTKKPFDQIFHLAGFKSIGINFNKEYKGVLGLRKLAQQIDHQKFDLVLDMHSVLRSFVLDIFSHTTFYRLNKGRAEKTKMIKAKERPQKPLLSMHERYAAVFKKAAIPLDLQSDLQPLSIENLPDLPFSIDSSHPIIGIAPFSAHLSKEYPLAQMKTVIEKIQAELEVTILLFGGGQEEEEKLKTLAESFDNVFSTAGLLSLKNQMKWMSPLKLMLSMDSGNGHLAAAMGIPVITIWGATHPFLGFQPFNQPQENQISPDAKLYPALPVSVFGKTKDDYYTQAIGSIPALTIAQKVIEKTKN